MQEQLPRTRKLCGLLHSNGCPDRRVALIIEKFVVFEAEIEQVFFCRIQFHRWQWIGVPAQLRLHLVQVIQVNVHVTQCENKITRLQAAYLSNHQGQQRIGRDIERHAQKDIRAALIHLAA